jgi:hypothetical protein
MGGCYSQFITLKFWKIGAQPGRCRQVAVVQRFDSIVKPVYNDPPWVPQKVAVAQKSLEVLQSKLVLKSVWPDLVWPLLTGGRYSEVVVKTGLIVQVFGEREQKCNLPIIEC